MKPLLSVIGLITLLFTIASSVLAGPPSPTTCGVNPQICSGTCVHDSCRLNDAQICGCYPPATDPITTPDSAIHN